MKIFYSFLLFGIAMYVALTIRNLHPSMMGEIVKWQILTLCCTLGFCAGCFKLLNKWALVKLALIIQILGSWLTLSYALNDKIGFYCAEFLIVWFLVIFMFCYKLPLRLGQVCFSLIVAIISLPLVDAVMFHSANADQPKTCYSFAEAKQNPEAFKHWWQSFNTQAMLLHKSIGEKSPDPTLPYRLKPNSKGWFFESKISINSKGFRGKEISDKKKLRIMAIGESTTFGYTMNKGQKTWPEMLEELTGAEVINAGVYGYTIQDNIHRLQTELLALHPDVIISYHGYNFFPSLNKAIKEVRTKAAPVLRERPVKFLAAIEYKLHLIAYQHRRLNSSTTTPTQDPEAYTKAYETLADICKTNNIKLILSNFSMAVNANSDPEGVRFYKAGFPEVKETISANEQHTKIVAAVAARHPEITLANTQPYLDGKHENYIDLVHFTESGDKAMAEIFYKALNE